jgi:hypothetical protein
LPAKVGIIIVAVEVGTRGEQPQISYTSSMPKDAAAAVLTDLVPRLSDG